MRIIKLSQDFYLRYSECEEILQKENRPYLCLEVCIDDIKYAIPIRHHIHHKYYFPTIDEAGLDFTKAIPLLDETFISSDAARIDTKEWRIIMRGEKRIIFEFKKYINQYKRALKHPDNPRSENILKYSSLQYFELG